ncbi:response regulator [Candidatus Magnetomonas plexicatena]|uniref:response regulator n=1 Tax=Candidatus Magnetomonas plexicatena TaxID=2552947 RepID=UPI001C75E815|nr:DUF3369 domain-containing protein [Nitrospirales bacterium LBB_01]
MDESEQIVFADEKQPQSVKKQWKVMIVDDEEDIHKVTKLALGKLNFQNKKLNFLSAYSAEEAKKLIAENPDMSVILLDVVMESDDSGLQLVKYIRDELKNKFVRIILRTGQPGQAPEENVIIDYDINDYKTKEELTDKKLFTTLISSLRAYTDIRVIESNRKGLEKIIEAAASLSNVDSVKILVNGMLSQLISILRLERDSIFGQTVGFLSDKTNGDFLILSGTGAYETSAGKKVKEVIDPTVLKNLDIACQEQKSLFFDNHCIVFFQNNKYLNSFLYLEGFTAFDNHDKELIEHFCANVSNALEKALLQERIETVKSLAINSILKLTECICTNDCGHIHRTGKTAGLLAGALMAKGKLYGTDDPTFPQQLEIAATVYHDIGRLCNLEDDILNLNKLDEHKRRDISEYLFIVNEVIERALEINSNKYLYMAMDIIRHKFTRFDGTGYPENLSGEEIPLSARIAYVSDFYDCLIGEKVGAMDSKSALLSIKKLSGSVFDPDIVSCLEDVISGRDG